MPKPKDSSFLKTTNNPPRHKEETDEEEAILEQGDAEEALVLEQQVKSKTRPEIKLVTSERALSVSLMAVRFAVFADSVSATILDPNFAFMALPNAHPDSFESTGPFSVSAATYWLAMTALLGAAISSTFIGGLSDKVGRKPCILLCLVVGAVGAICNYLARKSFWAFSGTNFAQGLFAATVPVSMAYVSDVRPKRKEKDAEIGILVALFMIGSAGGGVVAILMETQGLFAPLFVGAALNLFATLGVLFFCIEPNKMLFQGIRDTQVVDEEEEEELANQPTEINKRVMWNIIVGALFDNIGSAGILPIAMAPLALNEFYINFVAAGEEPIMSQSAFKWISVMVALTVVPGASFGQYVYDKVGQAAGCVIGNLVTAVIIVVLLYLAYIDPATNGTFGGFITAMYVGFPFTVLSRLSTGPMLDAIAPISQRGYVQGMNIAVMNFASAISPYLLGEMSDNIGIRETMWTCVVVSIVAAFVNLPLVYSPILGRPKKQVPKYARALRGEDGDIVYLALKGEWVPAKDLNQLNEERMAKGEPFLIVPFGTYEADKPRLNTFRRQARSDFLYIQNRTLEYLNDERYQEEENRRELIERFETSTTSREQVERIKADMGVWFTDYLEDNGYWVDDSPILYKQMIMQAFPPVNKGPDLTADNMMQFGVNYVRVMNKYLSDEELSGSAKAFAGSVVA